MGCSMVVLLTIAVLRAASAYLAPPPAPSAPVGIAVQVSHGASVTETPSLVGVRNATQRSSDSTQAR